MADLGGGWSIGGTDALPGADATPPPVDVGKGWKISGQAETPAPATKTPGMVAPGNIDLAAQPRVKNADGSTSTVRSMSFNEDGKEILIPTVAHDGSGILTQGEAIDQYHRTGKHLGIFDEPQSATAYASQLHNDYAAGKYDSAVNPPAPAVRRNPRTGLPMTEVPLGTGPLGLLDQPLLGAQQIVKGAQEFAQPNPEPQDKSTWRRNPRTGLMMRGAPVGEQQAGGAARMLGGAMQAATPLLPAAAVAAPIGTALTVGAATLADKGVSAGLKAAGVEPGYADLGGVVAAGLVGGGGAKVLLDKARAAAGNPEIKIGGKFEEPKPFSEMSDPELVAHANKIEADPPKNYDWQKEQIVQEVGKRQAARGMPEAPAAETPTPAAPADLGKGWTVDPVEARIEAAIQPQEQAEIAKRAKPAEAPEAAQPAVVAQPPIEAPAAPQSEPVGQGWSVEPAPAVEATPEVLPAVQPAAAPSEPVERGPGWMGNVPTSSLSVDPPRFQYKSDVGQGGAGEESRAITKWDPEKAGVSAVWHDPTDAQDYVVNGHNRFATASRLDVPEFPVRYLDAQTAQEARLKGALINIAEGRGESTDAAKVFRDSGMTPEQLQAEGVSLKGKVAGEGLALSHLAQPIFNDVISGELSPARGAVIGAGVPDPVDQQSLYDLVKQREKGGKRLTNDQIGELIRLTNEAPKQTETQDSLFGSEEMTRSLLPEKAEVSDYIRKQLATEKKLFGVVGTQAAAERLGESGNVIKAGENKAQSEATNQGMLLYDKLSSKAGPISDALDKAARSIAEGESTHEVKQRAYRAIRDQLTTQVRQLSGVPQVNGRGTEGLGSQGPLQAGRGQLDQPQQEVAPAATPATPPATTPEGELQSQPVPKQGGPGDNPLPEKPQTPAGEILYHGTAHDFAEFRHNELGIHFGTREQAESRLATLKAGEKGRLIQARLHGNPKFIEMPDLGSFDSVNEVTHSVGLQKLLGAPYLRKIRSQWQEIFEDQFRKYGNDPNDMMKGIKPEFRARSDAEQRAWEEKRFDEIRAKLIAKGFDGIKYPNAHEGTGYSYNIFDPKKTLEILPSESTAQQSPAASPTPKANPLKLAAAKNALQVAERKTKLTKPTRGERIAAVDKQIAALEAQIQAQRSAGLPGGSERGSFSPVAAGDKLRMAELQARLKAAKQESLVSPELEQQSKTDDESGANRLLGAQLTAQLKSGMAARPSKLEPVQTRSMFDEPRQETMGLFGDAERGSFSVRPANVRAGRKPGSPAFTGRLQEQNRQYGLNVREWFTARRDLWGARVNQELEGLRKIVPDPVDQEGLSIYRDFKSKPGELKQWLAGTHLGYGEVQNVGHARENIEKLRPAIERAMNPTPAMLDADKVLTKIAEVSLAEGQKLGFIDKHVKPEEYVTHLLTPETEEDTPSLADRAGKLIGGKIGRNFPYNQHRTFPTILEAAANNYSPRTLNAFGAFQQYGDKFATARATHLLIQQLRASNVGIWGAKSDKGIPRDWVEIAPHAHPFRNLVGYEDKEGQPQGAYQTLFVPKVVEEALRPITDPEYTSKIAGFRKLRVFQSYTKAAQLSLSYFHATSENYMALANMGASGWLKALKADRSSPDFLEQERDLIGHGGTTSIQGRIYEAPQSPTVSSLPTAAEAWRNLAGVRQVDHLAQKITEFTFGRMQRQFKVVDYATHKAAWLAQHPNATPAEENAALRSIAKEVNAVYGGLHFENLGINKSTVEAARAILLAPDWTFSNIFNVKYAIEKGTPAGKLARMFWLRAVVGGMVATQAASLMLSRKTSKRPTQVYMGTDGDGKDIYQNLFFKGAPGDLANVIGNVKDYGAVVGLARTVGNKMAPGLRTAMELMRNEKFMGGPVVPKGLNPVAGTVRATFEAAKGIAPIPWSAGNVKDMLFGPDSHKYKIPLEVLTTLFAGTPPSHVSEKPEKPQQGIWDQIVTGKASAPAPKESANPIQSMKRQQQRILKGK